MPLIMLDTLSHESHIYVMGPSSGERYATWVANVEFRIFGNTIRFCFAL